MTKPGERAAHGAALSDVFDHHARGLAPYRIADRLGMPLSRTQRLLSQALSQLPDMTVEDWRRTTLVRLDVLAETYGDLLEDADPNVRLRAAKGLASVERDRAELFAGGWSLNPKDHP